MGPDPKKTLTRLECRARGHRIIGWCAEHGQREQDLSKRSKRDGDRLQDLWDAKLLTCGVCRRPLSVVTVRGTVNALVGEGVLAQWEEPNVSAPFEVGQRTEDGKVVVSVKVGK